MGYTCYDFKRNYWLRILGYIYMYKCIHVDTILTENCMIGAISVFGSSELMIWVQSQVTANFFPYFLFFYLQKLLSFLVIVVRPNMKALSRADLYVLFFTELQLCKFYANAILLSLDRIHLFVVFCARLTRN